MRLVRVPHPPGAAAVSNANIERTVGQLEGAVKALQTDMNAVQATLKGQDDKLDKLLAYHNQRKGAQRVSKVLLSVVTSGSVLGWLWEHFHK